MNRGYRYGSEQQQFTKKVQALRMLAIAIVFFVLLGFLLKIIVF